MDRTFKLAISGAAVAVVVLVLVYGPVVTAFFVAGASFALMIVLIALSGMHAFGHWWRGHPWTARRTRVH